jgi:hypothetical protein
MTNAEISFLFRSVNESGQLKNEMTTGRMMLVPGKIHSKTYGLHRRFAMRSDGSLMWPWLYCCIAELACPFQHYRFKRYCLTPKFDTRVTSKLKMDIDWAIGF